MKFHHDFHHQAYITNLNKAMSGKDTVSLVSLMPGAKAAKLNNAGGGHYNRACRPTAQKKQPPPPRHSCCCSSVADACSRRARV